VVDIDDTEVRSCEERKFDIMRISGRRRRRETRSAIFRSSRSCPANLAQKVFDPIITSAIFSKGKEYDRAVR